MRWGTRGSSNGWSSTQRRSLALALAALALLCAVTIFRPPKTAGPDGRDFEAYYSAGATANAGGDPYGRAIWNVERTIPGVDASRDEILPFIGPAAFLPLWSLFARLPFATALRIWDGVLTLAFAAFTLSILALAGASRDRFLIVAGALFALVTGPMLSDLALGQDALLSAAGLALALFAYERRSWWAIPAVFLTAMQPNIALALIPRMSSRFAIAIASIAAALFALATLAFGGGGNGLRDYVHRLGEHGRSETFVLIQHTVPAIVASFAVSRSAALTIGGIIAFCAIALALVVAARFHRAPLAATLAGIGLLPLAVPFFHEHDFVIEIIPIVILALCGDRIVRACAGVAAVLVLTDWLGHAQRPLAHAQIVALTVAVAFAFTALRRRGDVWNAADALPILMGILVSAISVPLAQSLPAPTWPDALGAYHAAPGADISAVWNEEQRRAGLEQLHATWGALRAIPLVGCCFIAAAAIRHAAQRTAQRI